VASKLISQYGFSKDNLKVLLGGWNTWNERHTTDPNGYPTDTTAGAPAQQPGDAITVVPQNPAVTVPTTAP